MLLLAAFSLLGFFRLARLASNTIVAIASTILAAVYPVFFTQSSLAQIDLPAAGFIFWGLASYFGVEDGNTIVGARASSPVPWAAVCWFSLAALAKETAILIPFTLIAFQSARRFLSTSRELCHSEVPAKREARNLQFVKSSREKTQAESGDNSPGSATEEFSIRQQIWLALSAIPLALWYAYHYLRTGRVFGNPEFFRYNVQSTLHPLRIFLALLLRIWQTVGYLDFYVLTLACVAAMMFPAITDKDGERRRIALSVQYTFLAIIIVYLIALSVIGGAVLARYMLPVVPPVILVCVSTIWRRLSAWKLVLAVIVLAFISALFINPPYGFAPEDNLGYRDYILLHQGAETFLEQKFPNAHVLTAWPASDELTRPYLGYVNKPIQVVRIDDFSAEQLLAAADYRSRFDLALIFSTKYQPHTILDRWPLWQEWKSRYFDYHVDLTPEAAASVLGGTLVYVERLRGQWVGVVQLDRIEEAGFR